MKTLRTAVVTMAVIICLSACGNAGARNKKKATDNTPKAVVELTSGEFNSKVFDTSLDNAKFLGDKPAIVDFSATWCGPCQRLSPILEELAKEYEGKVDIYKVDVDKCRELAETFNISSIPAMLFIPMEGEAFMLVGLRNKAELQKKIEEIL
ncbi:MAG: thioredoxin [Bacteroidales bacterium]|nr:thioredoxin [Bacteroidales bacterium]